SPSSKSGSPLLRFLHLGKQTSVNDPGTPASQSSSKQTQNTSPSPNSQSAAPHAGATGSQANPSTNGSTGLQTYQNSSYNFSFTYPGTLQVKENSYGLGVSSISFTNSSGDTDFQALIFPKNIGNLIGQNFDTYYAMANNTTTVIKSPQGDSQQITKVLN